MNVSCPNCATVYRVDPAKVPEGGVRARCSICSAVFAVGREAEARASTPGAGSSGVAAGAGLPPGGPRPASPASGRPSAAAPRPHRSRRSTGGSAAEPATPSPRVGTRRPGTAVRAEAPPPGPPVAAARPTSFPPPAVPAGAPRAPMPPPASPSGHVPPAPARRARRPRLRLHLQRVGARCSAEPAAVAALDPDAAQGATGSRPVNPFLSQDPALKARRLARALISDMVVYHPAKRQEGLRDGNLKELFEEEIRKSWEEYAEQVGKDLADSTPYFNEALNEILAGGRQIF